MIATAAPLKRLRLNRKRGQNRYELKQRFAELCQEHEVELLLVSSKSDDEWTTQKDERRCELIDKSLHQDLSPVEQAELDRLQIQAEDHFDTIAPPPIDGALQIHAELLKLKKKSHD